MFVTKTSTGEDINDEIPDNFKLEQDGDLHIRSTTDPGQVGLGGLILSYKDIPQSLEKPWSIGQSVAKQLIFKQDGVSTMVLDSSQGIETNLDINCDNIYASWVHSSHQHFDDESCTMGKHIKISEDPTTNHFKISKRININNMPVALNAYTLSDLQTWGNSLNPVFTINNISDMDHSHWIRFARTKLGNSIELKNILPDSEYIEVFNSNTNNLNDLQNVKLSGNQTINGIKTFNNTIKVDRIETIDNQCRLGNSNDPIKKIYCKELFTEQSRVNAASSWLGDFHHLGISNGRTSIIKRKLTMPFYFSSNGVVDQDFINEGCTQATASLEQVQSIANTKGLSSDLSIIFPPNNYSNDFDLETKFDKIIITSDNNQPYLSIKGNQPYLYLQTADNNYRYELFYTSGDAQLGTGVIESSDYYKAHYINNNPNDKIWEYNSSGIDLGIGKTLRYNSGTDIQTQITSNLNNFANYTTTLNINSKNTSQDNAIALNTAKTGITSQQASDITANNAKTGITSQQASDITANNAKTGITSQQASDITTNTSNITTNTNNIATKVSTSGDLTLNGKYKISNTGNTGFDNLCLECFNATGNALTSIQSGNYGRTEFRGGSKINFSQWGRIESNNGALTLNSSDGHISCESDMDLNSGKVYKINGSQISSSNLSNDSNLVKIDANNEITGENNFHKTITITGQGNNARGIKFKEAANNGGHRVELKAPDSCASYDLTFPAAAPTSDGQILSSTTAGVMSWSDSGGGGINLASIVFTNNSQGTRPYPTIGSSNSYANGQVFIGRAGGYARIPPYNQVDVGWFCDVYNDGAWYLRISTYQYGEDGTNSTNQFIRGERTTGGREQLNDDLTNSRRWGKLVLWKRENDEEDWLLLPHD